MVRRSVQAETQLSSGNWISQRKRNKRQMARSLVIVESPAKAKTINKYFGRGYTVKASYGHVMDLPTKTIGILLPGEQNGKRKKKRNRKPRPARKPNPRNQRRSRS